MTLLSHRINQFVKTPVVRLEGVALFGVNHSFYRGGEDDDGSPCMGF